MLCSSDERALNVAPTKISPCNVFFNQVSRVRVVGFLYIKLCVCVCVCVCVLISRALWVGVVWWGKEIWRFIRHEGEGGATFSARLAEGGEGTIWELSHIEL